MHGSIGKLRRLQRCATADGHFVIMAVDHRDNLRDMLQATHPDGTVGYAGLVDFKLAVTDALRGTYSAALLDPQFGAAQAIAAGALPGQAGLIVSVEKWGYSGDPLARETSVLAQWGVDKIARMGGDGVKMLLYYHPDAPNAAAQEAVVRDVAAACRAHDVPFFLEPIAYALDPARAGLSSAEKRPLVLHAARTFSAMGVDILKAEFPLNIADEPDERVWAEACAELTAASRVPWVLLSAGVGFDDFARQTRVACAAGCSGVMVGRAVWQEAVALEGAARARFLAATAVPRMQHLADLCRHHARPLSTAAAVDEEWYRRYGG